MPFCSVGDRGGRCHLMVWCALLSFGWQRESVGVLRSDDANQIDMAHALVIASRFRGPARGSSIGELGSARTLVDKSP